MHGNSFVAPQVFRQMEASSSLMTSESSVESKTQTQAHATRTCRILRNKQAVSPVIAVVLIIALVVAASGIVWLLVMNMTETDADIAAENPSFFDADDNGFYDEARITIVNPGTSDINPTGLRITDSIEAKTTTWTFTTLNNIGPGLGDTLTAIAGEEGDQLQSNQNIEIVIEYVAEGEEDPNQELLLRSDFFLAQLVSSSVDIIEPLVARTSTDDSSTCRSTFPGPGYSPTLFFILGVYGSGTIGQDAILQEIGVEEQEYRPFLNDTQEFTTGDPSESNNGFMAYNDSGNYPGLISFYGSSFDAADPLNWQGKGVVYVGFYIYNPTTAAMDVAVFMQGDDNTKLYGEGELLGGHSIWNKWTSVGYEYSLIPGYNYFLLKCYDGGGNFDGQVLFVDVNTTDPMDQLQSRWVVLPPQGGTPPAGPDALQYRVSADDTGTSSSTFPGPGYSPKKWFVLGRFEAGHSSSETRMSVDYLDVAGYGSESSYRPYMGSGHTFSDNELDNTTGYEFEAIEDAGNHRGLIDFIGGDSSRFDKGDSYSWIGRGIAYAGAYIYNPEPTEMTVSLSAQSDDDFYMWFNGAFLENHTFSSPAWNTWGQLNNVAIQPGLNYVLIKTGDRGGNWDVNFLITDHGSEDDLRTLTAIWPTEAPMPLLVREDHKTKSNSHEGESDPATNIVRTPNRGICLLSEFTAFAEAAMSSQSETSRAWDGRRSTCL